MFFSQRINHTKKKKSCKFFFVKKYINLVSVVIDGLLNSHRQVVVLGEDVVISAKEGLIRMQW